MTEEDERYIRAALGRIEGKVDNINATVSKNTVRIAVLEAQMNSADAAMKSDVERLSKLSDEFIIVRTKFGMVYAGVAFVVSLLVSGLASLITHMTGR